MNTGLAYRVRARAAIDYQVKCTVAGTIMDIVIITIVIVVCIKWRLRCIDFCGFDVDDHKSDGAAQPWQLLQRILPMFREMLTYTARGVEKMFQGPELPEKASPSCQANHEQHCNFRRSRRS